MKTNHETCPLCHAKVGAQATQVQGTLYPAYDTKEYRTKTRISRLAIFLGVLTVLICLAINIIVLPEFLWVFYVAVSVFYVLILLSHTILSRSHLGGKIVAQVVSLTILLLVIDLMSGSIQWSVDYVVPFLIVGGILLMSIIILKVRLRWGGYVSFLLLMLALGFLPALFYVAGVATVLWPSIVAALFAMTTFSAIFLFANRAFKTQLGRRFHI
ncbi:DUF6320 domain-containing protein [Salinicoccus hispanicus]|uniref:DUF6320 domain-containing protein n=1 Tax=Salinicoccus hispanicus TaxID=157225 RepID=UPI001B860C24|nr:DUF6320 domain-containing protein [Salinicoccus hispanicus]